MNGRIKKLGNGFGFIKSDEDHAEYFFHTSALETSETGVHFHELFEGQQVEFEPTSTAKGPRAEQVRLV